MWKSCRIKLLVVLSHGWYSAHSVRNELNRNKFYVHFPLCVLLFFALQLSMAMVFVVAVSFVMVLISSFIFKWQYSLSNVAELRSSWFSNPTELNCAELKFTFLMIYQVGCGRAHTPTHTITNTRSTTSWLFIRSCWHGPHSFSYILYAFLALLSARSNQTGVW